MLEDPTFTILLAWMFTMGLTLNDDDFTGPPPGAFADNLLLETGDAILLEDGGAILLE